MALDEALLESAPQLARPVLRLYSWTGPAATFGYTQSYSQAAALTQLRPLVRRPTGGGLVQHDADWTYSLVFPPQHFWHRLRAVDSYRRLHEWIGAALARINVPATLAPSSQKEIPGQCFAGPGEVRPALAGAKNRGRGAAANAAGIADPGFGAAAAGPGPGPAGVGIGPVRRSGGGVESVARRTAAGNAGPPPARGEIRPSQLQPKTVSRH